MYFKALFLSIFVLFSFAAFSQNCDFPYTVDWNEFVKDKCIDEIGYFRYLFNKNSKEFEDCKQKNYHSRKVWNDFLDSVGVVDEDYHWSTVDVVGQLSFKNNNCYNYATRLNTRSFAQPGRSSKGEERNQDLKKRCHDDYRDKDSEQKACEPFVCGAVADGLKKVRSAYECKSYEVAVALAVTTQKKYRDFHWYRLDSNGYWSHKPGPGKPEKLDYSGKRITNPEEADRGLYHYFCGYMCVDHNKVKIE